MNMVKVHQRSKSSGEVGVSERLLAGRCRYGYARVQSRGSV